YDGCTWWLSLRVVVGFLGIVYGQTRSFKLRTSTILSSGAFVPF
ncbi:hypothetical protein A2U01_0069629, partial [Trifolium medium]|nr:hypothetical protein [Trifolium medium]